MSPEQSRENVARDDVEKRCTALGDCTSSAAESTRSVRRSTTKRVTKPPVPPFKRAIPNVERRPNARACYFEWRELRTRANSRARDRARARSPCALESSWWMTTIIFRGSDGSTSAPMLRNTCPSIKIARDRAPSLRKRRRNKKQTPPSQRVDKHNTSQTTTPAKP